MRFEPGSSHTAVRHVTARPLRHSYVSWEGQTPKPPDKSSTACHPTQRTSSFLHLHTKGAFAMVVTVRWVARQQVDQINPICYLSPITADHSTGSYHSQWACRNHFVQQSTKNIIRVRNESLPKNDKFTSPQGLICISQNSNCSSLKRSSASSTISARSRCIPSWFMSARSRRSSYSAVFRWLYASFRHSSPSFFCNSLTEAVKVTIR